MKTRRATLVALAATLVFTITGIVSAAEPTYTTINVEKMCCDGCAQKIAGQLYVVKGVKEVRVNMEKKLVFVIPQQSKVVSPRAMWEAVQKGEDNPLRLAGPSGTFTTKPRS